MATDPLLGMRPGAEPVVSCYLKLEPRDRARRKYLTKLKNRVKELAYALPSLGWDKHAEHAIRHDLDRIVAYLDDPAHLPPSAGVAVFASTPLHLFEVRELPRVHRSRLAVDHSPLVRELVASGEEVGRLFTVTLDRSTALIWEVTAFGARVARKVTSPVTRGGRYHAANARSDATGEHTFHNRIRDQKRRHFEGVARALFELDRTSPGHQLVLTGSGSDATAFEPYLHTYLADRLIGVARLAPRDATPSAVHQLTMDVHTQHARLSETRHVTELTEALGTGWAVNGVEASLKALATGQVRLLLVRGDATVRGFRSLLTGRLSTLARDLRGDGQVIPSVDIIDDAIEEALRQRVAVDVIYTPEAAGTIDGLAGLLRFK
jgi:peptide subunit release factor 1 (eRF1)